MIEALDNVVALSSDPFTGQCVAPAGKISYWAATEGGDPMGNPVAEMVIQRGIPFGHGSNKVIKGVEYAMTKDAAGKSKRNEFTGPSGRRYVELQVDAADMVEKQIWEGSVSEDAVRAAQGGSPIKNGAIDEQGNTLMSAKVTGVTDEFKKLSDDEIDAINEKRLRTITAEHP